MHTWAHVPTHPTYMIHTNTHTKEKDKTRVYSCYIIHVKTHRTSPAEFQHQGVRLTREDSKYKVSWTTYIVRPEGIKA